MEVRGVQVWANMILRMQLLKPQAFQCQCQRYFAPPVPIDCVRSESSRGVTPAHELSEPKGPRPSRTQAASAAPPGERACSGGMARPKRFEPLTSKFVESGVGCV